MTDPIWEDDRLNRAYGERFGGRAPAELTTDVIDRVRSTRGARSSRMPAWAAAAAAALVVAIGTGIVLWGPPPQVADRSPGPPRSIVPPSSPVSVEGFPAEVLGLPVISVSEAIALRDAGPDDTEIAVRGFVPPGPLHPISCPAPARPPTPVELGCPEFITSWLTELPELLFKSTATGSEGSPPTGPALQPLFRIETPRQLAGGPDPDADEPVPAVLVGHFADQRSGLCPDAEGCRREFVVDARVWVAGDLAGREVVRALDQPAGGAAEPQLSAERAILAALWRPEAPKAVWVAALTRQYLDQVDPRVAEVPALAAAEVVWIVRQLVEDAGRPVVLTVFVVDGTREAFIGSAAGIEPLAPIVPVDPSPDPTFPTEAYGLPVISSNEALAFLDTAWSGDLDRLDTELAVRGYLVLPPRSIACPLPRPDIEPLNPIDRSCPAGVTWLLETPEPPWEEVDGVRTWVRPIPTALHPLFLPEVPLDLPAEFADPESAKPMPVVIVGHFGDLRGHTDIEARRFVVDTLVWQAGQPVLPRTVIAGADPSEGQAEVEARVRGALGLAQFTWATVVDGAGLTAVDPSTDGELLSAPAVWQLARLVEENGRPVVRFAWTVDGGHRIWSRAGLAPERRVEILAPGGRTVGIAVIDWADFVSAARPTEAGVIDPLEPRVVVQGATVPIRLSNPEGRPNDLRIRWTATDCDELWTLWVADGSFDLGPTRRDDCQGIAVEVDIVLTFTQPTPAVGVVWGGGGAGG